MNFLDYTFDNDFLAYDFVLNLALGILIFSVFFSLGTTIDITIGS